MKVLLKLFPAGHFVIALLFVCASIGLIVLTVALTIETLVLTFRFGAEAPENLPYVAMIGLTAAVLLAAGGLFVHLNRSAEELEPEAMQQAKREDRKIDEGDKR